MTTTYQITVTGLRPFTAAVVVRDGIVVEAAPILRRWCGYNRRTGRYDGLLWTQVQESLRWAFGGENRNKVTWREV